MQHLTVFVLACFLGFQVIWNVTPALHTPLMSVTNAISGIIVIGALLQIGNGIVAGQGARGCLGADRDDQHLRRLLGHAPHAEDVPTGLTRSSWRSATSSSRTSAPRTLHPEPRRLEQAGDRAARQRLRRARHGDRDRGHRATALQSAASSC